MFAQCDPEVYTLTSSCCSPRYRQSELIAEVVLPVEELYKSHTFFSFVLFFFSFSISGSPRRACPGHVSTLRWHGEQTGRDRSCQSYLFLLLPDLWSQGESSVILLSLHVYTDLTLFLALTRGSRLRPSVYQTSAAVALLSRSDRYFVSSSHPFLDDG